jgi:diguanylate cyclase (GGDEF)-like protein
VWSTTLVHLNMLFPLGLVSLALYDAWRKGSRMVIYPLLGWTPAMGVGLLRIVTYVLPGSATPDVSVLYSFALAIEVIVTAVGIVGRFILLRQERDSAMTRAEEMEGIVGRDPLTGLNNRLSIERRFDELLSGGFRTMAVIDLDHFKDVNDTHGHATGDAVLKATARAIAGDRDTHAIRMGRGVHAAAAGPFAAERAERARRAITARVAAEVAGLDRIVTASMGLIEHDGDNPDLAAFDSLYAHCDRLLYEAKRSGRNRTVRDLLAASRSRRWCRRCRSRQPGAFSCPRPDLSQAGRIDPLERGPADRPEIDVLPEQVARLVGSFDGDADQVRSTRQERFDGADRDRLAVAPVDHVLFGQVQVHRPRDSGFDRFRPGFCGRALSGRRGGLGHGRISNGGRARPDGEAPGRPLSGPAPTRRRAGAEHRSCPDARNPGSRWPRGVRPAARRPG